MTLPDYAVLQEGTQICFADFSGDFSPTAANDLRQGSPTQVQIALTGVLDTEARQSAKFDFGVNRAALYSVSAALEFAATPTAGDVVNFYLATSNSSTAATGNPGGVSGSDADYTGYSSNLAASLKQLMHIGTFVCTTQITTTVQIQTDCGQFSPTMRYGSLVLEDQSGANIHSDDVECHVVFTPISHVFVDAL